MGLFGKTPSPLARGSLAELQKRELPTWTARFNEGHLYFENKGFKTMGSKTVFGNAITDWFEAILAGTLTEAGDFGRNYEFLKGQYLSLLKGLKDILENIWPDAWQDPAALQPITLGPRKRGGKALVWTLYGMHWITGSLKFLQKMARRHNDLLSAHGKSGLVPAWDPSIFEHTHTFQDVKAGIFTVDQQDLVSFPGGPAALGREIQRLGG